MKFAGTATLDASPQQVFDAFHDPAVLERCLPGCEQLTPVGPDEYAMTVTAGVAAVKGTYDGRVALLDPVPAERFTLKASGAGGPGTVAADVVVTLVPSATGGTELSYDADAVVGGVIGGVGQRMLTGVTRKMAGQFFAAVDADIAGVRREAATSRAVVVEELGVDTAPVGGRPATTGSGRRDFGWGVLTGGAVALIGVIVGWSIGGRR
jgi:carbon monoxide dehydrogenase subunit G